MLDPGSIAATFGLFAFAVNPASNADTISKSWALCAASSTIVTGTLHVPVRELRAAHRGGGGYVSATVDVSEVLKGERSEALTVTFSSEDRAFAPKSDALIALDGRPVLLFLAAIPDDTGSGRLKTYFTSDAANAVRARSAPEVMEIRAEIARQAAVLRTWRPHPEWPHEAEVKHLIAETLVRETAERAFRDLENLGPDAVPAIADLMDDRRPLGVAHIVLSNSPGAFEAQRIYGPKLVVDALAAILNQITGDDYGSIMDGASERQRRLAVNGWRIYADMRRNHTRRRAGVTSETPR